MFAPGAKYIIPPPALGVSAARATTSGSSLILSFTWTRSRGPLNLAKAREKPMEEHNFRPNQRLNRGVVASRRLEAKPTAAKRTALRATRPAGKNESEKRRQRRLANKFLAFGIEWSRDRNPRWPVTSILQKGVRSSFDPRFGNSECDLFRGTLQVTESDRSVKSRGEGPA